jgi:hypothetical protein
MSRTFDPFDELAAMFLTTPQASDLQEAARVTPSRVSPQPSVMMNPTNGAASAPSPIVELLIAGHLPVRGGLWMTPYADAIARVSGAVGLIRMDGEEAMLQIIDPGREDQPREESTLEKAIAAHGETVNTWVIRTAAGTPWADLAAAPVDRFTILTSADEAAIVAAYQIIKDLAEASLQINRKLTSVGLAVVGVDQSAAKSAIERLNRTTGSFLEVEVKLAMCLPRIDTGLKSSRCMLFGGQAAPSFADIMQWANQARTTPRRREADHQNIAGKLYADRETSVMHAGDVLRVPSPMQSTAAHAPLMPPPAPIPIHPPVPLPRPAARQMPPASPDLMTLIPSPATLSPRAQPIQPQVSLPKPPLQQREPASPPQPIIETPRELHATPIKLAPKPSTHVEAKHPAKPVEPDDHGQPVPLSNYIANLTPLPIRCPNHERIEIAVDRDGGLHLLGRESALRDLQIVEAWTKSHRELIAMACPQHPIDHMHKTITHVFTPEPSTLADLHGSGLRLHVLAPVNVNGQTAWYAAALNK